MIGCLAFHHSLQVVSLNRAEVATLSAAVAGKQPIGEGYKILIESLAGL